MPLVYQQNINGSARLAIWNILEDEHFFLQHITLLSDIRHPHKRLQHLAGRYILHDLYPEFPLQNIRFSPTNKPFLPGDPLHFSISHCGDYAAAIISESNRVGIDVELITPKILRVKHKFLTPQEEILFTGCTAQQAATIAWTAKESIFKWYGTGSVDFIKHITAKKVLFNKAQFSLTFLFSKGLQVELEVKGHFMNELCMAWVIAP